MRIKSLLVAALLLAGPLAAFSQTFKLDWTEATKLEGGNASAAVNTLGQVDGRLYLMADEYLGAGRQFRLMSYNTSLEDLKTTSLALKAPFSDSHRLQGYYLNTTSRKLHMLSRKVNSATKELVLQATSFDLDGKRLGDPNVLFKTVLAGARVGQLNKSDAAFKLSDDSTKAMLYQELPGKNKEPGVFSVTVMDADFTQLLWQRDVTLPYTQKGSEIAAVNLAPDGTVYLAFYVREESAARAAGNARYYFTIFRVAADGEPQEYVLKLGKEEIETMALVVNEDGSLRCNGFYGPKNSTKNSSGFFSFTIKDFGSEPVNKIQQIIPDLYGDVASNKKLEYVYKKTYDRPDGGQVILAEQYRLVIVRTNSGYATTTTFHYWYGPIAVMNLNPNNELAWVTRVPRLQHTVNDGGYFSSFYSTPYKDKLVMFYNDDPDNVSVLQDARGNDIDQARKMKNSVIFAAVVDKDGKLSKQIITEIGPADQANSTLIPRQSRQIDATHHLVMARWRKSIRLGLLTITD